MTRRPQVSVQGTDPALTGLAFGLLAYGLWGVLPIYFKQLPSVNPVDIVAHRVTWSLPFLAILLWLGRGWAGIAEGLRDRRTLLILAVCAVLVATNWLVYVYAVTSGHILAGSLGYYLNPLMNIILARFVLAERLTRLQWGAVAIAAAGVAILAAGAGTTLWISLVLCVTFSTYGLLRKIVAVNAVTGLAIETFILFPLALGWLALGLAGGRPILGASEGEAGLLLLAGVVSTTPLLLFTAAARRLRYSTLGMLQFVAPTLQFLLAVGLYGEAFGRAQQLAFGAIWTALALYVASLLHDMRAQRRAANAPELCES